MYYLHSRHQISTDIHHIPSTWNSQTLSRPDPDPDCYQNLITYSFYHPSTKFHHNPSIPFCVMLLTDKQTYTTKKNIMFLAEIIICLGLYLSDHWSGRNCIAHVTAMNIWKAIQYNKLTVTLPKQALRFLVYSPSVHLKS